MLLTMNDKIDARTQYFLACAQDLCRENLAGIARTDSYLRQPDYFSRASGHYYLILREAAGQKAVFRVRYLQAEFPELVLNYLTERELAGYPAHGVWQFHTCAWLYRNDIVDLVLKDGESDLPEAVRQAIFGSAHAARLYYLRDLPAKTHTWGVRQLGWAMRYAENAICKLLGLLKTGEYQIRTVAGLNEEDIGWLMHANENWQPLEHRLLENVDEFRHTAARLSGIIECYSKHMVSCYRDTQPLVAEEAEAPPESIRAMTEPIVMAMSDTFGNRMLSYYLHGSAARGDMRADSDIDTMAVFDHVDAEILERTRLIQRSFNKLTSSVYSVDNIKQYPKFRRYGLINGTRLHHPSGGPRVSRGWLLWPSRSLHA
ncbi:nucleotidyltransferase domain-containing protein [Cupriavidus necator]|uniref:nucleotidyltransferase domain-containing protein n=1 Tax=Cupriavidus necator TaxID=106590 RepID=UPI0009B855B2|nr:nucleotidyltransferase domain-containing protein [Cupriavidus necator]